MLKRIIEAIKSLFASSREPIAAGHFEFPTSAKAGRQEPFWISNAEMAQHAFLFGTSGRGTSHAVHEMAAKRGISYEDMERQLAPTPEETQKHEEKYAMRKENEKRRINAAREAYWEASLPDLDGLHHFSENLSEFCEIETPTIAQQKALFMMVPNQIFGLGLQYGFDDSVVRDDLYVYVQEHADKIKQALAALPENRQD